jgi:4-amino-4-deoxy-L-arabinose transferase-like glycosyltransferase
LPWHKNPFFNKQEIVNSENANPHPIIENVNPQWIIYLCLAAIIFLYLLFVLFAIKLWRHATKGRNRQQESEEYQEPLN